MATPDDIRRLALALPEAVEAPHFDTASFRVNGKIFCTIHVQHPRIMVKLDPEDQRNLTQAHPGVVEPVPGGWGRGGATFVDYEKADLAVIETLLRMAYVKVTTSRPKRRRL